MVTSLIVKFTDDDDKNVKTFTLSKIPDDTTTDNLKALAVAYGNVVDAAGHKYTKRVDTDITEA